MADEVKKAAAAAGVPQYVLDHAPLVHIHSKDPYKPSAMRNTLANTRPQIDRKDIPIPHPPLTLSNLDQLNSVGKGDVYLTSNVDITTNPKWLEGINPDASGSIGTEKAGVIIVVNKGNGIVDAFYMYFWAFNWGGVVLEKQLGDHVGDWEHNMVRFINGVPKYVWFSQHANGEAYKFEILEKDKSGKRPISYAANGSHALYATAGTHDHTIPNLNLPFKLLLVDETNKGPIFDPLLSSYYFSYVPTPANDQYTPYSSPTFPAAPKEFLLFRGRWGDAEMPGNDKRQDDLAGNKKYVGGPTGPADKQLDRKEMWPNNKWAKGQKIRTTLGKSIGDQFKDVFGKLNSFGTKTQKVDVSGEKLN